MDTTQPGKLTQRLMETVQFKSASLGTRLRLMITP